MALDVGDGGMKSHRLISRTPVGGALAYACERWRAACRLGELKVEPPDSERCRILCSARRSKTAPQIPSLQLGWSWYGLVFVPTLIVRVTAGIRRGLIV